MRRTRAKSLVTRHSSLVKSLTSTVLALLASGAVSAYASGDEILQRICKWSDDVLVGHAIDQYQVIRDGHPYTITEFQVLWSSADDIGTHGVWTLEQYGGCIDGRCRANSTVGDVDVGETWVMWVSRTPTRVSPIALGNLGMFRVEYPEGGATHPHLGAATIRSTSDDAVLVTEDGWFDAVTESAEPQSTVLGFIESTLAFCAAPPAAPAQ